MEGIRKRAKELGIDGWASKSVKDLSREINAAAVAAMDMAAPALKKKKSPGRPKKKADPADVNKDGKVDEKDLSAVHKAYSKAKPKAKKKAPAKKKK